MSKKQPLMNAGEIIERFGGIRPMAAKINTPVTTVQGWKKRDVIPAARRSAILSAAIEHNVDIDDLAMLEASNESAPVSKSTSKKKKTANKAKSKKDVAAKKETKSAAKKKNVSKTSVPVLAPLKEGVNATLDDDVAESKEEIAQQPMAAPKRAEVDSVQRIQDDAVHEQLLSEIKSNNRKAITYSAWIATGLILLALVTGLFLFWPYLKANKEAQNTQYEEMVTTQKKTDRENKFLGTSLPDNFQERIDGLQNQTRNISITVDQLSKRAKEISTDVLGDSAQAISERLDVVEKKIEELSGPDGSYASIVARVHDLENSVVGQVQLENSADQLRSMVGGAYNNLSDGLANAQNEEEGDLGRTLEGVSGQDLKAAAILIAFSQFRSSLEREQPFEEDLALLQGLVGEENTELKENLTRLSQHADGGVLTATGLSRELKKVAGDVVVSSLKGEDVSIKEKMKSHFGDIVQVEKDGEMLSGTQTQATISKAQGYMDQGKIEDGVATLESLDGEAALSIAPFLEKAKGTLLAEKVKGMINESILSKATKPMSSISNIDLPSVESLPDIGKVKESLDGVVPSVDGDEIVKDDGSGIIINPQSSNAFKGFSAGE